MQRFETVIGLEVHIQLLTESKAFSNDRNHFILEPNQNISAVTLALPGTLPVANRAQMHKAVKLGLAFDCQLNEYHYFDRKNYFYPDLPKGYQITQDAQPFCRGGKITFVTQGQSRTIRIHHIHMEEDAGKSSHDQSDIYSVIDYNRAGTPLLELVTEPDFRSGQEVHDFLAHLQKVVQYLGVSDGNMEEGSIRCDCNVSVMPIGSSTYGERREIKNVNSKKFAKTAIDYEAQAQIKAIEQGERITKTTMLFDPEKGVTRPMRKKETENDYRYFPDPDLPPMHISAALIAEIKSSIDWLPETLSMELSEVFKVPIHHLESITEVKSYGQYFIKLAAKINDHKELADLLAIKLIPRSKEKNIDLDQVLTEEKISDIIDLITSQSASKSAIYQTLLPEIFENPNSNIQDKAIQLGLIIEESEENIDDKVSAIINNFPDKVKEYKSGKKGLIGFFMGQVVKEIGNQANPTKLNAIIDKILNQ
jgi:aspartyl-tRNA(Asn)/glutamyl-tRNA(Gln) amidotransferase subunit B